MTPNPPQTLSVKRKRNEIIPHSLVIQDQEELNAKRQRSGIFEWRQKSGNFVWRLVQKPGSEMPPPPPSPVTQPQPHFRPHKAGSRVLIHRPQHETPISTYEAADTDIQQLPQAEPRPIPPQPEQVTSRPRKRPGASTALPGVKPVVAEKLSKTAEPSEEAVRQFEKFSLEVEQDEKKKETDKPAWTNFKPKVPALRYKDRHPEKVAADAARDLDAMELDDYVYETYVREEVMLDEDGNLPVPEGTVGIIVLNEEDEDFWNEEESDHEFDTDDEDENAEEYYANDYPEDELSSDDEFGRNPYKSSHRHGSDDEEYNLDDSSDDDERSDGDEDDEHFRRIGMPKGPRF